MKSIAIAIILLLICCSCDQHEEGDFVKIGAHGEAIYYGGEVYDVELFCSPECPSKRDVAKYVRKIEKLFSNHVKDSHSVVKGTEIYWSNKEMHIVGTDMPVYGMAYPWSKQIIIWYPYECPNRPKGLCSGIFDYEMGHLFMYSIDPSGTELEWLQYREKYNLLKAEE